MRAHSLRRLLWAGPAATGAAILVIGLYYAVSKALGEQYLLPVEGNSSHFSPMSVTAPAIATLAAGLVATVFFALLIRFARKPETVFLSVAVTALLLSFGGPSSLPGVTMQTKILLSGMHVLAAVIITGGIILLSREKRKHELPRI